MLRRLAALVAMILILAVVISLVWTVHLHRRTTSAPDDGVMSQRLVFPIDLREEQA